jgi:hypothetical protein
MPLFAFSSLSLLLLFPRTNRIGIPPGKSFISPQLAAFISTASHIFLREIHPFSARNLREYVRLDASSDRG